jgi:hypothetical protein
MPSIFEWIERLNFLRGMPAVFLVLIMALLITVAWDWRLTILALTGQYLLLGLLYIDVLDPRLAIIKLFAGFFVCLILYMTARQVNYGRLPVDVNAEEAVGLGLESRVRVGPYMLPTSMPFRFFAALLVLLAVWVLAQRPGFLLPAIPSELNHLNFAIYGLSGLGLLGLGLTADPLRAGLGIFLLLAGFELYYSVLEQSVAMLAALAAANLVLALVITYLTQARHALPALVD